MFGCKAGPVCCDTGRICGGCQPFPAPTLPAQACPWDVLTVQHDRSAYRLRRCTLASTPLLSGVAGYSAGQTLPFYQPDGVGPALSGTGAYELPCERRAALFGSHPENADDCGTEDAGDGGAGLVFNPALGCNAAPVFSGGEQIIWEDFNENLPAYVRPTAPDENGHRWAVYEMGAFANGSSQSFPLKLALWNLTTGESWLYKLTDQASQDLVLSLLSGPGAVLLGTIEGVGVGRAMAVGKTRRVHMLRWDWGDQRVWTLEINYSTGVAGGGWIPSARVAVRSYSWAGGVRATAAWQLDDSRYTLEIEQGDAATSVWARGADGSAVLLTNAAPATGYPFCYQRVGTRHLFLWNTVNRSIPLGDHLYDIDEAGAECDRSEPASAIYADIGARGEQLIVEPGRALGDGWEVPCAAQSNASISRESWHGWTHVRGATYGANRDNLRNPADWSPGSTTGTGSTTTQDAASFAVHPDGPAVGVTHGRQYTADNRTDYSGTQVSTGGEIVQFVGELWRGAFDRQEDIVLAAPPMWAEGNFQGSIPSYLYARGLPAAPMPGHFGAGAGGAY